MMNGLKVEPDVDQIEEIHFDQAVAVSTVNDPRNAAANVKPNDGARESLADKNRREHEAYMKERKENPAFVPTRGGFFLHDNRASPAANGFRQPVRGRGRGRGQFGNTGVS